MSITIERRGDKIVVLKADAQIPENKPIILFTEEEIAKRLGYTPLEFVQLERIFHEKEEDWGDSLDALTLPVQALPRSGGALPPST